MKTILSATVWILSAALAAADEPPSSPAVPGPAVPAVGTATAVAPAASAPESTTPAEPAPIPVVRLPGGPVAATPAATKESAAEGGTPGQGELGWRADGVTLRQSPGMAGATVRSNRVSEPGGVLPRLARPERRGFGGFLAGFANLFNPFAPTRHGVAAGETHWYDGQGNIAPKPRAFRDERTHEPTTTLISLDVDPDLPREEAAPATPEPAKREAK